MRIISLVPSLTELLFEIGLEEHIVGVTRFCIHPPIAKKKTKIGGTKNIKIQKVIDLKPSLIIANNEENTKSDVQTLQAHGIKVLVTNIKSLKDAYHTFNKIGQHTNRMEQITILNNSIQEEFKNVPNLKNKKVLYLIWHNPKMGAGIDTFIHYLLTQLNVQNVIDTHRYPEIDVTQITRIKPDYIFLSSEPFPFSEKHVKEYQDIFPKSKILLVDGEMFSWYGARLLKAPKYFRKLAKQLQ